MVKLPKFYVKFYEWDCNFGDMIDRWEDVVEVRSELELKRSLQRSLDSIIRDARRRRWDCDYIDELRVVCYKGELCREVGYEYYRRSE